MNSQSPLEDLALRDPNKLMKKLGAESGMYGTGVSPVPPGVPIVDNEDTRDAAYPIRRTR